MQHIPTSVDIKNISYVGGFEPGVRYKQLYLFALSLNKDRTLTDTRPDRHVRGRRAPDKGSRMVRRTYVRLCYQMILKFIV